MRSLLVGSIVALGLVISLPETAQAGPKVLICYADFNNNAPSQISTGINGKKDFDVIDTMDCSAQTPSLVKLKTYDAVYLWDDSQYADKVTLGNNLADYVDAGGGVVQGMFNFYHPNTAWDLQGRWATGNYNCITPANQTTDSMKKSPNDANSDLVKNVATFTSQNLGNGGLTKGSVSVWDYTNGNPVIATCSPNGHLRVETNFYPVPTNWTGDGYNIIHNALIAVAGGLSPLKAAPNPVVFPDTGTGATSDTVTVTITNMSMAAATATSIAITGLASTEFGIVSQPNFPVTLQPNDTFTVKMNFSPLAVGNRAAIMAIAIAGMNVAPAQIPLSGNGIGAKIVVTPNPAAIGGTQIGMSVQSNLTVSNKGGGKILIKSISVGNPAFVITASPDLPISISGGGTFPLTISFTPSMNGITKDTLTVTTDDPNTPTLSIPMSGYAGAPAIGTDTASVAFGSVNLTAKSVPQVVNVQNIGFSPLTVTGITLGGANPGDFILDSMKAVGVLQAQTNAPISLTFAPTANGSRTATVTITSTDVNTPTKILNLFGTGTTTTVSVMPNQLNFGDVRVKMPSKTIPVVLSAMGNGTVKVTGVTFTGANAANFFAVSPPVYPLSIASGKTQQFLFNCKPAAIGGLSANVTIVTDLGPQVLAATCNGISPLLSVSPNSMDFGAIPVGAASPQIPITLTNMGTDTLTLMDLSIAGANLNDFNFIEQASITADLGANGIQIPAMSSKTYHVSFTPTVAAAESGEIDFTGDDPLLMMGHISMKGLGAMAGLSVSPQLIDCGTVLAGASSAMQLVTITNSGMIDLNITSVALNGPGGQLFSLDMAPVAGTPWVLKPMTSRTFNVQFHPIAAGLVTATLNVTAKEIQAPLTSQVRGNGCGATLKFGLAGGSTTLDFGNVAPGATSAPPTEVFVLNSSMCDISIGSITVENPLFAIDSTMTNMMLKQGDMTSFLMTFSPKLAGAFMSTVSVKLLNGVSAVATLPVKGTGMAAPVVVPPSSGCSVSRSTGASNFGMLLLLGSVLALVARRRRS